MSALHGDQLLHVQIRQPLHAEQRHVAVHFVAQQAVEAFAQLAQKNNTMIVPSSLAEVSGLIASAMALTRSGAVRPG